MTAVGELGSLLRRDGDLELPTLTEEELAALAPLSPPYGHVVPLQTLLEATAERWEASARRGEASLIERRLLLDTEDGNLRASEELRAILGVREQPLTATIVEVRAGDEVVWDGAYFGSGSDEFRLEERAVDGEHRFRLRAPVAAAEDLARVVDPDGRAAATADDEETALTAVAAPERRVRLFGVRRTGEESIAQVEAQLVVSARGVWLVAGQVGAADGKPQLLARALTPSTLVETLREYVVAAAG